MTINQKNSIVRYLTKGKAKTLIELLNGDFTISTKNKINDYLEYRENQEFKELWIAQQGIINI